MIKENFSDRISLVTSCSTIKEATLAIHNYKPELIFLDVELQNETGFDLLQQLPEKNFDVIFTTAHDHYAIKALRFSAIDYLLKPFGPEDLGNALSRYEAHQQTKRSPRIDLLLQNLKTLSDPRKKMALPTANGYELNKIIRIESSNNYSIFFFTDKDQMVITRTLLDYEELLEDYNFIRVHQSHIINMAHIKSYNKTDGGTVTMNDGTTLDVSRRKREDFTKRLATMIR